MGRKGKFKPNMARVIYDIRDGRKDIWIAQSKAKALFEEGKLLIHRGEGYGVNESTPKLIDEGRYA